MKISLLVAALNLGSVPSFAQTDPDVFANKQSYTGAPHFVRQARLARRHVPDHWPFIEDEGELACVTVDGIAMAFFEVPGAGEPYMIGENMVATFLGSLITGQNDYVSADYDPAKLVVDIGKVYNAALIQCGPPYAQ